MEEIWKDIEDFEEYYQVSNRGRVKSLFREVPSSNKNNKTNIYPEIIRKQSMRRGYFNSVLCKKNVLKNRPTHRLVATAFIPNPENKPQVNHIDGNKLNNNAGNLEWATAKENRQHSIKNKLQEGIKGEDNWNSKLKESEVIEILQIHKMYGVKHRVIAKEYGVSGAVVSNILNRKIWKHIQI